MRMVWAALAATGLAATLGWPGTAAARVSITVDLSTQTMDVRTGAGETRHWGVSTARQGFETPLGTMAIFRMDKDHKSREYDGAPMPFSMFFKDGYAIHGSNERITGRPASHGCVRLAPVNAALLYGWVKKEGGDVTVVGEPPATTAVRTRSTTSRDPSFAEQEGELRYDTPGDDPGPRRGRRSGGSVQFGPTDDEPAGYGATHQPGDYDFGSGY